jgi:GntR family transcriptional regulator
MGANRNTALRALRTLRDEGLLEPGAAGITVVGTPARGALLAEARSLLRLAREHGYRREELIDLIEHLS